MYNVRIRLNKTQIEVAQASGISQSYISEIESGLKSPTLKTIEKLANALKIHPRELIEIIE